MQPSKRTRAILVSVVAAVSLALGAVGVATFQTTGKVRYRGREIRVPLLVPNLRVSSSEGRATYVMVWTSDAAKTLSARGRPLGIETFDQGGLGFNLPNPSEPDVWMGGVLMPRVGGYLAVVEFRVDPRTP
jgi:hypothetical protein